MNKQEILSEINKTKEHLANMEKMLEKCEYGRWKPKDGETWYYLDTYLEVIEDYYLTKTDSLFCKRYNCFQTREQAEAEAEKILVRRMLEDIVRRLDKGEKINWNDKNQIKYAIHFDFYLDRIDSFYRLHQKEQGAVYCLNKNFSSVAIQEIGEERLKKYLRGE